MDFTVSFVPTLVFGLKNKEVLVKFSCWPEESSLTLRILWISIALLIDALPNTKLSSAKNRCNILGPLAEAATPLIAFLWAVQWRRADNPSAQMIKR